jgi:hypothetical protein
VGPMATNDQSWLAAVNWGRPERPLDVHGFPVRPNDVIEVQATGMRSARLRHIVGSVNIRHALRTVVAPELNFLYTVPPFQHHGGITDCGWYCREHALHLRVLCAMLGVDADVRLGEFHLRCSIGRADSGESGDGHAWCRVKSTLPVDLSMTLELYWGTAGPQLYRSVFGTGHNGDYAIGYHRFDEPEPVTSHPNYIVFREHSRVDHSADSLIRNPYSFLNAPDTTNPKSWEVLYGFEIYARITMHCFTVLTARGKSIPKTLSQGDAARWVNRRYPNAVDAVLAELRRRRRSSSDMIDGAMERNG